MSLNSESLAQAANRLRTARRLVVFTGAGVSAESGIPTFRDDSGLWQRFPPEQFAHWRGLLRTAVTRPGMLAEFLHAVIEPIAIARRTHAAIAHPSSISTSVVTQMLIPCTRRRVAFACVAGNFFRVVTLGSRPVSATGARLRQWPTP